MMVAQINNLKNTIAGILLAIVFINSGFSQTKLFNEYTKFGFYGSLNSIGAGKTNYNVSDPPIRLTYSAYKAGSFGMNYRLLFKKNFIIKTGLHFNFYKDILNYEFDKGQIIGYNYDYDLTVGSNNFGNISIPLTIEYSLKINRKLYFSSFISYNISYMRITESRSQDITYNIDIIVDNPNREHSPFYNNFQVGAGFYIPVKFALFHLFAYYNKNFKEVLIGKYHIEGIQDRPYTQMEGTLTQSGDYIGFGLTIYPKKWWK